MPWAIVRVDDQHSRKSLVRRSLVAGGHDVYDDAPSDDQGQKLALETAAAAAVHAAIAIEYDAVCRKSSDTTTTTTTTTVATLRTKLVLFVADSTILTWFRPATIQTVRIQTTLT